MQVWCRLYTSLPPFLREQILSVLCIVFPTFNVLHPDPSSRFRVFWTVRVPLPPASGSRRARRESGAPVWPAYATASSPFPRRSAQVFFPHSACSRLNSC